MDAKVPISSTTFSREISSSATRTASPGLPLSSRDTISSGRPSTPPAALISSQRELHALLVRLEEGGEDLVAVQLAELDRLGGGRERRDHDGNAKGGAAKTADVHAGSVVGGNLATASLNAWRAQQVHPGDCGMPAPSQATQTAFLTDSPGCGDANPWIS